MELVTQKSDLSITLWHLALIAPKRIKTRHLYQITSSQTPTPASIVTLSTPTTHVLPRQLTSTEFLNLDAILEGVLEELVVRPLHGHIGDLWRRAAQRSGDTQRLAENFELARRRPADTLGLKCDQTPPSAAVLGSVRHFLGRMQDSASPLDKLESLLATVSALFSAAGERDASIPADDFLPLLLYALVHCHVTNVEVSRWTATGLG